MIATCGFTRPRSFTEDNAFHHFITTSYGRGRGVGRGLGGGLNLGVGVGRGVAVGVVLAVAVAVAVGVGWWLCVAVTVSQLQWVSELVSRSRKVPGSQLSWAIRS